MFEVWETYDGCPTKAVSNSLDYRGAVAIAKRLTNALNDANISDEAYINTDYQVKDLESGRFVRGRQAIPLYTVFITLGRNNVEIRRQTDDLDRIWYLVQEWLKQPKTNRISVENQQGKVVFSWSRC